MAGLNSRVLGIPPTQWGQVLLSHASILIPYATIPAALPHAVSGDAIYLGPGTFAMGTTVLDLSIGGTGTIHLIGTGPRASTITSTVDANVSGAIVRPGSNSYVANLSITTTFSDGRFQVPFGLIFVDDPDDDIEIDQGAPFTNAVIENCILTGDTDCILLGITGCSLKVVGCELNTKWDAVVTENSKTDGNTLSSVDLWDTIINVSGVSGAETDIASRQYHGLYATPGTMVATNCRILTTANSNAMSAGTSAGVVAFSSSTISLRNCFVASTNSGSGSIFDLVNSSSTLSVDIATVFTTFSGTISPIVTAVPFSLSRTVTNETALTADKSIPIVVNGVTYKMLLHS